MLSIIVWYDVDALYIRVFPCPQSFLDKISLGKNPYFPTLNETYFFDPNHEVSALSIIINQ